MILLPRYYIPTAISSMFGAAFGIALIDTVVEAVILGKEEVYITTGAISVIMLIIAVIWFDWRKREPSATTVL